MCLREDDSNKDRQPSSRRLAALCLLLFLPAFVLCEQLGLAMSPQEPTPAQLREMESSSLKEEVQRKQAGVQALARQLSSADLEERRDALAQLLDLKLPPEQGVPLFTSNLTNTSDEVRQGAIAALAQYGTKAQQAVPGLLKLAEDQTAEAFVQEEAIRALVKVDAHRAEVNSLLVRVLKRPNTLPSVHLAAIDALGDLGPAAREANSTLPMFLDDAATPIACKAYFALGKINSGRTLAISEISQQIQKLDRLPAAESSRIFWSVQQQGPKASTLVPILARIADTDPSRHFRCAAVQALGTVGPGRERATDALIHTLAADDDFLSDLASAALNKLTPEDLKAVLPLTTALKSSNPKVRLQAARSLAMIGPSASSAASTLADALLRADSATTGQEVDGYLNALSAMGPAASQAEIAITNVLTPDSRLLKNRSPIWVAYLRAHLFVTLADVGGTTGAMPLIVQALRENGVYPFAGAARAAGMLNVQAADAVPYLMRALQPDFSDQYIMLSFLMDTSARLEAIRALGKIGPQAAAAIPLLERIVTVPDSVLPSQKEARAAIESIRKR